MASAICGAVCVFVPRVSSDAVKLARPAATFGSNTLPAFTSAETLTRPVPERGTTTTRTPFGSFFANGVGKETVRGAEGAGGVSSGVNAPVAICGAAFGALRTAG